LFVFFFFSISAGQKATYKGTELQKPNMGLEVCHSPPPFTFLQSPSCLDSGTSLYHFPNVNLFNSLYIYIFHRPTDANQDA
jgi:hypothetical protein